MYVVKVNRDKVIVIEKTFNDEAKAMENYFRLLWAHVESAVSIHEEDL